MSIKEAIKTSVGEEDVYFADATAREQLAGIGRAVSGRNLLDNPWFTVNQRGATSYNRHSGQYTVDRWLQYQDGSADVGIDVVSGGVKLKHLNGGTYNLIAQVLEGDLVSALVDKAVTISLMLSDGTIVSHSWTFTDANTGLLNVSNELIVDYYIQGGVHREFRFSTYSSSNDYVIRAVKLELGSVSTLANDIAPDYPTELTKCQRYFERITDYATVNTSLVGVSYRDNPTAVIATANYSEKRVTPVVTIAATSARYICNFGHLTPTAVSPSVINTHACAIQFTLPSLEAPAFGWIDGINYIDISADL